MAQLEVVLFGRLRDIMAAPTLAIACEAPVTLERLRARIAEEFPDLAAEFGRRNVRFAVNQTLAADEAGFVVGPQDEIALLPPLSGG